MMKKMLTIFTALICAISSLSAVTISDWQTEKDLAGIVAIARQNKEFLCGHTEEDIQDWQYRFFYHVPSLKCLNSKGEYRFGSALYVKMLKDDAENVVGYIAYHLIKNKNAGWIFHLAIDPLAQGKGYAKQLMSYALTDMFAQGVSEVSLGTLTQNEKACGFYERYGFVARKQADDMTYYTYYHLDN